jgi:hypothetical protein
VACLCAAAGFGVLLGGGAWGGGWGGLGGAPPPPPPRLTRNTSSDTSCGRKYTTPLKRRMTPARCSASARSWASCSVSAAPLAGRGAAGVGWHNQLLKMHATYICYAMCTVLAIRLCAALPHSCFVPHRHWTLPASVDREARPDGTDQHVP